MLAVMRWIFLLLAMPALADTNLFTSADWMIDGVPGGGIQVVIDKEPTGGFAELKFFFNTGSNNFAQVFSVKDNGDWQPALPAPGNVGGLFRLGRYWDCEQGLMGALRVTELSWKRNPDKKGWLDLTGKMTNHNSLQADKLRLRFSPAATNDVRVDLDYSLKATRDFCVDVSRHEVQDEFRTITIVSNFTSTNEYVHDLARYIKLISKDCAGFYGCVTKKESFCIPLTNAPAGYLVNAPRRLGDERMWLVHTTESPRNTPSLAAVHFLPGHGRHKPQGLITPTDDPAVENVEFWSNWVDVKDSYKMKKKVGRFRIALEAVPPKSPNCDEVQEPAVP